MRQPIYGILALLLTLTSLAAKDAELPPIPDPIGFIDAHVQPSSDGFELTDTTLSLFMPPLTVDDTKLHITPRVRVTTMTGGQVDLLPQELYTFSLNANWQIPIDDRWRLLMGTSLIHASDLQASDRAWTGTARAIAAWQASDTWQFLVGAILSTNNDSSFVPAIGAIWKPNDTAVVRLVMPSPKVSFMIHESDDSQYWLYVKASIARSAWAYETNAHHDDMLTYKETRMMVGVESRIQPVRKQRQGPRPPFWYIEAGMAFNREVIVEIARPDIEMDSAFVVGAGFSF